MDLAWAKVEGGDIFAAVPDGAGGFYVGGSFDRVDGVPRNRLARLRPDGSLDPAFNPDVQNGDVLSLVLYANTLYVGGTFSRVNGPSGPIRKQLAALNTTTGIATAWDPNPTSSFAVPVRALVVEGTTLYAGGSFNVMGGQTRNRLAAFDLTTGALTAWNPNADQPVNALAVHGSTVYAGGSFTQVGAADRGATGSQRSTPQRAMRCRST